VRRAASGARLKPDVGRQDGRGSVSADRRRTEGETYLIYASDYDRQRNQYGTSICTRSVPLDQAELDLRVLGKGKLHGVERTTFKR